MAETFELGDLSVELAERVTTPATIPGVRSTEKREQVVIVTIGGSREASASAEFPAKEFYDFLFCKVFPPLVRRVNLQKKNR
jgi:hypothetical protein